MRIYISGGITGVENARQKFAEAEENLKRLFPGSQVLNPFLVNEQLPELHHSEYMKMSFCELDLCDAVYFLDNWKESRGANQEMGYAIAKGKKILFE